MIVRELLNGWRLICAEQNERLSTALREREREMMKFSVVVYRISKNDDGTANYCKEKHLDRAKAEVEALRISSAHDDPWAVVFDWSMESGIHNAVEYGPHSLWDWKSSRHGGKAEHFADYVRGVVEALANG